ncbi:hypothetical protein MASR2M48_20280 [Spirochaetota bacterium]
MPGINGLELLREAKKLGAYQIGILLTAYADKDPLASLINDELVDSAPRKPSIYPGSCLNTIALPGESGIIVIQATR